MPDSKPPPDWLSQHNQALTMAAEAAYNVWGRRSPLLTHFRDLQPETREEWVEMAQIAVLMYFAAMKSITDPNNKGTPNAGT
jgi:hypothetical protein